MLRLVWLLKWPVPWTPVLISKHLVSKYSIHIWKGILHCCCGDIVSMHFKTLVVITIDRHSSLSVLQISHEYSYKNLVHCIVGMAWAIVYNIKYTGGIWGWYVVKNWHRNVKDDIWALGEGAVLGLWGNLSNIAYSIGVMIPWIHCLLWELQVPPLEHAVTYQQISARKT